MDEKLVAMVHNLQLQMEEMNERVSTLEEENKELRTTVRHLNSRTSGLQRFG